MAHSDPQITHRKLAVAPMMELTDRHYRFLARMLTRSSLLYTEMLTAKAVIHGDREYLLGFDEVESPLVLQLGGSDPTEMAQATKIGEQWGYDEININCGCPSDRVQSGRFGACLMAEPKTVAACVGAMQDAVSVPVSVKCRLGIDRDDSYEALQAFVREVSQTGCKHFIVHARKAWLDGLSPKENRNVPPLRYEYVYRLKQEMPDLHITINGGIDDWEAVQEHMQHVDGVMIGRKAYHDPSFLQYADHLLFGAAEPSAEQLLQQRIDAARAYARYVQQWHEQGVKVSTLTRHLIALFVQVPGARLWRRHLSENAPKCTDAVALVEEALLHVSQPAESQSA